MYSITSLFLFLSFLHLNLANVDDVESLDWIAAAPYTYNHLVGGGAYNNRYVGEYKDTVESLEGRQETCDDLVTYILAITMKDTVTDKENSLEFYLMFTADSTGQSGVALAELVHWRVNGPQKVENGNGGGTGPGVGAGNYSVDGFYKDNGATATISGAVGYFRVVNGVTDVIFNQGAEYHVYFRIDGLSAGDQIPVCLDIRLKCNFGSTPTGNLQASLTAANLITDKNGKTAIPGGQQTVPFKTVSDIRGLTACDITDADGPIKGVNFTAQVTVTSASMTNGGIYESNFYYSWSSGAYVISSSSTGITQTHTFDLECTYLHSGEYLWSQGTCGCESTWIGNNQPQLFYDPLGKYYNYPPTQGPTINGVPTLKYTAIDSTKAVSELYLSTDSKSTIVRAVWTDGKTMDFANVIYGPVPPSTFAAPSETCACKRRLDIALVLDKSSYINDITYPAQKAFALNFAQEFTISSSNAQFAVMEFADTVTTILGINSGTTETNVISKISALVCKLVNKACGSAPPNVANAINKAVIELKSSSRSLAATPAIVVVTQGWESTQTSAIAAAAKSARDQGIDVFAVVYTQDAKSFAMPKDLVVQAFGDDYHVIIRFDANDLEVIIPDDIAAKLCKLNTRPCGSLCCGVCDTACGTCLPVDECNEPFPNCVNETVVSGSCCVTRLKADTCTYDAAACQYASCNAQSGSCVTVSTCKAPIGDNCYNYKCDNGKCIQTLNVPSTPTKCSTYSCVNNLVVATPVNCGTSTKCVNYKCDDAKGGCYVEPIDDLNPSTDLCIKRICDPAIGWKNDPVQCPTTDPCFPNACVKGVCELTPIVCNDPNNLCDISKCDKGVCVNDQVQCTPMSPCYESACNPASGTCVQKKKVCVATACANVECNDQTGICEEVATPGCTVGCDCVKPSTTCVKQRCDVGTTTCGAEVTVDCSALAPDYCSIATPCDETNGCVYTNNDCSTVSPTDDCHVVIRDPTNPACCVQKEKNCEGVNPCKSYSCDINNGGCVENDLCVPTSDKCVTSTCTATGCVPITKQCTAPDPCYSASCDSLTGECVYTLKSCDDKDPCTTDSCDPKNNGECKYTPIVCDDTNVCTIDSCQAGSCAVEKIDCNDKIDCTVDSCDPVNGCSHQPNDEVCKNADPCVISKCDVKDGCVESEATCPETNLFCLTSSCVAYQGCVEESRACGENSTAPCTYYSCDEDKDTCQEEALVCGIAVDTTVLVGSVLGTAAIAGIIIAVVIIFAGVTGGTAYAVYQSGAGDGATSTASNPLYVDDGNSGDNPLHQVSV